MKNTTRKVIIYKDIRYKLYNIHYTAIFNDIALMKLSSPAPHTVNDYAPHISKISLPVQFDFRFPYPMQMCYTKGFGCTSGRLNTSINIYL